MNTKQEYVIGDCLYLLPSIPDKSIDMILTDLPYGTSGNKWDSIIDINRLFIEYLRIIKDDCAIVLTASQPFTSKLISENLGVFKYCWVWDKINPGGGFLNANCRPLLSHEDIVVFSKGGCTNGSKIPMRYIPQKTPRRFKEQDKLNQYVQKAKDPKLNHLKKRDLISVTRTHRHPKTILTFGNANKNDVVHSTQKPLSLWEYLIKTYTNEGDWVHDSCLGSGTTLEACMNTNRNCIGFEISDEWEHHYVKRLRSDNSKLDTWL